MWLCVFATLELSLRDSDPTNQDLEALILAQAVEYQLDFEVDHEVIAFLKTLSCELPLITTFGSADESSPRAKIIVDDYPVL